MQRDIELFEIFDLSQKTEPILFFYTWDKPAITLGKAQREREQIMAEASELGIDCFVRPTGGKAVCHGGDICYTFIGAQSDSVYGGRLRDSFKAVNEMVVEMVNGVLFTRSDVSLFEKVHLQGLRSLNKAELAEPPMMTCLSERNAADGTSRTSSNCFEHLVCNEGLFLDHKIVGAAQAMGKRAFIQQGSIQLNKPGFELQSMTTNVTLSELTGQDYDLPDLCNELLYSAPV